MSLGANVNQTAVTVGTSATQIIGARFSRRSVLIQNLDSAAIFIGSSTLTTSGATQGVSIAANASLTLDTSNGALYAISAAGTAANAVRVLEFYS